jgi:hypothetical protein
MKINFNEEQLEAHQAEANKQRLAYKSALTKQQLKVFELAEQLQAEANKANIPFLLFIAANKKESETYRFHNFFSSKFKNVFSQRSMENAGRWARAFAGSCYRFLHEVCLFRVILINPISNETIIDSEEEE